MIGLIVTGHGHFATGLTTSLNLIAGDAKDYVAVDFEATDSTDDLAGGTPFKTAVEIGFPKGNVEVVAGTNLGMLVEINLTRTFSEDVHALAESACNVGKDQVMRYVFQHIEQNDDFSDGI